MIPFLSTIMSSRDNMDAATSLVKQTFYTIGSIEPPGPDASPRTRQSFQQMVRTTTQACGQALSLAIGMGELLNGIDGSPVDLDLGVANWGMLLTLHLPPDHGSCTSPVNFLADNDDIAQSDDEDSSDTQSQRSDDESQPDPIETFISEIFLNSDEEEEGYAQYVLADLRNTVLRGAHAGSVLQQEKEAFRRMVIGYAPISHDDVVRVFYFLPSCSHLTYHSFGS